MKTLTAAGIAALVFAGVSLADQQADTWKLTATLTPSAEVDKPTGVTAGTKGTFTGTITEPTNQYGRPRIEWQLKFSKLTGPALKAYVHIGKDGKNGYVLLGLCRHCKNGQEGTTTFAEARLRYFKRGRTYVNVYTWKNLSGEIRGRVKATRG